MGSCKAESVLIVLRDLFCVLHVLSNISVVLLLRIFFYACAHTCAYIYRYLLINILIRKSLYIKNSL